MSTHKHIDKICCVVLVLTLILSASFVFTNAFGSEEQKTVFGYENRLFNTSRVHTVDIVMNDWESFIESCTNEEYAKCNVVIDGEAYKNVAIRAKGNTSLSTVKNTNTDRYSFKIEFDHYDNTNTYYGLDKLCLNNIIQDNTYMKDYLTYQMMNEFGVASPLCSYVNITVNGEAWGLYLAVEAVEESFLLRNYGKNYGDLYKPDNINMGGGKGNGKDFQMGEFAAVEQLPKGDFADSKAENGSFVKPPNFQDGGMNGQGGKGGSSDVSLIYSDDNYSSYSNIFGSAKTDITDADKDRLISAIKAMNQQNDMGSCVLVEDVIKYFVVHNFVVNFDSYTGSMIHNYYLYESNGVLSMIPWDYNLAFGGFAMVTDDTDLVNYPIDSPISSGTIESRPMISWIFASEEYTSLYHSMFSDFISSYFESGKFESMIDSVKALISPFVEKDKTKFCTYEEFVKGIDTLKEFCLLRSESIRGQLNGVIGSTSEAQSDKSNFISAENISIYDMGTMNNVAPGGAGGQMTPPNMQGGQMTPPNMQGGQMTTPDMQGGQMTPPDMQGGQMTPPNMQGGQMTPPNMQGDQMTPPDMQGGVNNSKGNSPNAIGDSFVGTVGSIEKDKNVPTDKIVFVASIVVLMFGILFAFFFKRRR